MKSLIRLILISFFIIAYVMVESSHGLESTESQELTADELDDLLEYIKKSSKLMKINEYSNHECETEMEEHIKALAVLWKETDEAIEKNEDTTTENQGGPVEIENVGEDLCADSGGPPIRPPRKLKAGNFKSLTRKRSYSLFFSVLCPLEKNH